MAAEDRSWEQLLRAAREQLGISRAELARRASIPSDTLRRWEDGSRHPTELRLRAVLEALKVTGSDANRIFQAAGYEPKPTLFPNWRFPNYFYTAEELRESVEQVPWPEFVLDNNVELVAANRAAGAVWGVDLTQELARRSKVQLSLLSVASNHHFADRVVNWDEVVATLVAVFKGQPQNPESLDEPSAYFSAVLAEFAAGDPAFLQRLFPVWEATPPMEGKCRWSYRVVWKDPDFGEMRFHCIVSTASEPDGLAFSDWIPRDAGTWEVLEQVKQQRR
jgi:transcriptional regulator with XRE-family HTH domain